jgi:hypothetical protein
MKAGEELHHERCNNINVLVQCEMTGVQEMNFGVGNFTFESERPSDCKERIELAPHDERNPPTRPILKPVAESQVEDGRGVSSYELFRSTFS